MLGAMVGLDVEVVGVEQMSTPPGWLKVYIGHMMHHRFLIMDDPEAQAELKQAWARGYQRIFIERPKADQVFCDADYVVED